MRLAWLIPLALAACDNFTTPPIVYQGHGVTITIDEAPARIQVVRDSDEQVIYDGLPGGAAGTPDAPEVAAAYRDATLSIEQQVGSWKFDDDKKTPWTGAVTFQNTRVDGDTIAIGLGGPGGSRVGHLTITVGEVAGASDGAGIDVRMTWTVAPAGPVNALSIAYACQPDEHFLGLGGQAWDVDHRGQTVPLWVQEDGVGKSDNDDYVGAWFLSGRRHTTHLPMPMFLSTRGYAVAVDSDARSIFAFCSEDEGVVRLETWQPTLDLHLFVGEGNPSTVASVVRAIDLMTAWVGRPEVPNDVLFAPWLDALYGDANLRRVAQKLRDSDIAASVIWTEDWRGAEESVGGYQLLENWKVDRTLYPDLEGTADVLHGLGYRFLTYNNTFLENRADVYPEAIDNDYEIHHDDGTPYTFEGNTFKPESLVDLWNPDAVAWTKDIFREGEAEGADGWMADFGEWMPSDATLADGGDPMLRHNRYTVEWAKLNHDLAVERSATDPVGLLYFMRSSWIHSQPLVQMVWPGDQQTDWTLGDGFPSVIPPGIGLGVTGFPYYAHDIGGYMSELTVPTTKELWFRWCELGALTPVMRTHHGRAAMMNWNWESDAETTALMSRYTKLHMQLVPYLAARAEEAFATGLPIMRPVGLIDRDDDWAWTTTDEYLLGDRILVAPVITEAAVTRDVQLPAGRWYPLLAGPAVEGGATITVDAPVDEIPAFVPAGAILVEYPFAVDTVVDSPGDGSIVTAASVGDDREVVVYAGIATRAEVATHTLRGATYTWSGRDPSAPAPNSATFAGAPVTVTPTANGVSVTVSGPGELSFEGGGTLTMTGAIGATTVTLRL